MAELNLLESVLLGLLVRRSAAGYDLRRYLEDQGRVFGYTPQSSQIYRQLAALVDRGLLEYDVDTERGGPDAKVYTPTPAGIALLPRVGGGDVRAQPAPLHAHFQRHFALAGGVSPVLALRIVETELAYRVAQERDYEPVEFVAADESRRARCSTRSGRQRPASGRRSRPRPGGGPHLVAHDDAPEAPARGRADGCRVAR